MTPSYPPEQGGSNPWQRLLEYVTHALGGNTDDGFNFATGIDFGFAIAIRHPEYAMAMRRATQEEGMPGSKVNTEKLVDDFVRSVPIMMKGEPQ